MNGLIKVNHATKAIKGRTVLDDASLELERGGTYGFSGANGSGKTMLFRAISGLIHLTSGTVEVFGQKIGSDVDFPSNMGIVLGSSGFMDEKTGRRNLEMLASIRGVIGLPEVDDIMRRVGLDPEDDRPFSAYSLGMRQRLSIAQAVMERPRLLILDEPTNALDVDGVDMVIELLLEEHGRGATILVASHNEPKLESLCDRRFRMVGGRVAGEADCDES